MYHPAPELFVRQHATQDIRRFDDDAHRRWMGATTGRLLAQARQDGLNLREALEKLFSNHPVELQRYLLAYYAAPWCHEPLAAAGLVPDLLQAHVHAQSNLHRWRQWIPPALGTMIRRRRNRG